MAQVVEYLPSKCEALSSKPSTIKKKKKKAKVDNYSSIFGVQFYEC
jgi:hypothetical protein